ncbi:hypothetical protein nublan006_01680 [Klebsiella pneumoniae]
MVWPLKSTGVQQGRFPLKSANRRSADKAGLTPKRNVKQNPPSPYPSSKGRGDRPVVVAAWSIPVTDR